MKIYLGLILAIFSLGIIRELVQKPISENINYANKAEILPVNIKNDKSAKDFITYALFKDSVKNILHRIDSTQVEIMAIKKDVDTKTWAILGCIIGAIAIFLGVFGYEIFDRYTLKKKMLDVDALIEEKIGNALNLLRLDNDIQRIGWFIKYGEYNFADKQIVKIMPKANGNHEFRKHATSCYIKTGRYKEAKDMLLCSLTNADNAEALPYTLLNLAEVLLFKKEFAEYNEIVNDYSFYFKDPQILYYYEKLTFYLKREKDKLKNIIESNEPIRQITFEAWSFENLFCFLSREQEQLGKDKVDTEMRRYLLCIVNKLKLPQKIHKINFM